MKPYLEDADFTLYCGDVLEVLRQLPAESVDCVVTSPPYWGLRDYGTAEWQGGDEACDHTPDFQPRSERPNVTGAGIGRGGYADEQQRGTQAYRERCGKCGARRVDDQLGLEPTPEQYVERMTEVFREVRRVLAKHGTCWVNMGDSYAGSWGNQGRKEERGTQRPIRGEMLTPVHDGRYPDSGSNTGAWVNDHPSLKPKDLCGIPWRLAFALQADGWYLRSDIIWSKPNPMPESVTDRPTKAHEYVFLLTRSPRYYFDAEAVREPYVAKTVGNWSRATYDARDHNGRAGTYRHEYQHPELGRPAQTETLPGLPGEAPRGPDGRRKTTVQAGDGSAQHRDGERWPSSGRNVRSVWDITTQPYAEAHFATFPEELVRRCLAAGSSERGVCPECEAPWVRETAVEYVKGYRSGHLGRGRSNAGDPQPADMSIYPALDKRVTTIGWRPSCECHGWAYRWTDEDGDLQTTYIFPADDEREQADRLLPATVLDPFMGSGTTALVARRHGRHAVGIELNEDYCAMAATRLQQLSLFAEAPA